MYTYIDVGAVHIHILDLVKLKVQTTTEKKAAADILAVHP
jgi:hypothetical protein